MNARWLARSAFVLMLAAVAVLIGFAGLGGLIMIVIGVIGAVLVVAGLYTFLAHRGVLRWIAAAVMILTPVAILVLFALHSLIWVALVSVALMVLAVGAARLALKPAAADPGMPSREVPPPKRAFLIMNPRSGGGKAPLLRGARGQGLTTLTAGEVVVDAEAPEVPVGIDGETVMMPTPVRCTIQPKALRVRVPRNRPGVPPPKAALDWPTLRQLASLRVPDRQAADSESLTRPRDPRRV